MLQTGNIICGCTGPAAPTDPHTTPVRWPAGYPAELHVAGNRLATPDGVAVWLQGLSVDGMQLAPSGEHILETIPVAIDQWHANVIRLAAQDDFWFGHGKGQTRTEDGLAYREAVDQAVAATASRGAYLALDLHRFGAPTPAHVAFWQDAAARYRNHPAVFLELFNEMHSVSWQVWRDGGSLKSEANRHTDVNVAENQERSAGETTPGMQALGAAGIASTPDINFNLNSTVILGAAQTWSYGSGILIPSGATDTAGYTLTLGGGATKQFKAPILGGGDLLVTGGKLQLSNGATATNSAITVNSGATLDFDVKRGSNTRAASVRLNGATLTAKPDVGTGGVSNQTDAITGTLTVGRGASTVTFTQVASANEKITAAHFARSAGGTVLFRGTSLGLNPITALTINSANMVFTNAPSLVGADGAAGTTTMSILVGAIGDTTAAGTGLGATGGLVTYDPANGVRLLNAGTEYTSGIIDGQSQLDNVRYVSTSGSGVLTNTLYANTTINSLSFSETGTGTNTGITIMGDTLGRQLVLNSGTIWVRQAVASAVPSDAITITNLTLDLNGREGVFFIATTGLNQGNTPAPLYINCVITNDGGNGITINGNNGEIILSGNTTNRYTGATTVNSGILRLNKAVQNTGIPGDLVMNGGTLLTAVESVPDTADVTLNGGSFYFDSTTSSGNGGRQETIRNFTMNGGTLNYNSGTDSRFYINGNATINAGDLRHNTGGDVTVRGTTTLNGGRVLVSYASSTNSANALFTLNTLAITNLVSGGYTGIAFRAHNTNKGGLLTLTGDVAVVCNSINTNSVFFESENAALTNQGAIALSDLRTFDIGDGAAANDLVIVPAITNAAIIGALVKAGAGTLALNGASTYTGPTSVTNGTLLVNGGLVSPVTVWDGAVLGGTGRITTNATAVTVKAGGSVNPGTIGGVGTLTVTGAVDFASGSVLAVDLSGATADRLAVSGNVTGSGPVQVSVTTTNKGAWLIMTAANIAPAFTTDAPGLVVTKKENDTQLWLQTPVGTRIIVR